MTAEVEIMVGTYENILAIPVGAVTEHFQLSYVYIAHGSEFTRKVVKTVGRPIRLSRFLKVSSQASRLRWTLIDVEPMILLRPNRKAGANQPASTPSGDSAAGAPQ